MCDPRWVWQGFVNFFCWFTKVIVFLNIVSLEETIKHATHMGGMTKHGSVTKKNML